MQWVCRPFQRSLSQINYKWTALAFSVLTDECDPRQPQTIDIPDIMAAAKKAEQSLIVLVKKLISTLISLFSSSSVVVVERDER